MALKYNHDIFNDFRTLAITNVKDLVIGQTYYSNFHSPFTLAEIISGKEYWQRDLESRHDSESSNLDYIRSLIESETDKPKWMIDTDGNGHSLNDDNIGNSYNPWLLFDNLETAEACREELKVEIYRDGIDFIFDVFEDY